MIPPQPPSEPLFQVIATGHALPEQDPEQVRERLENQLRLPPATAARLLAGRPVILKRTLTAALAEDYANRLRRAGLAVDVTPMPETPVSAAPVPPPTIATPDYFTDTTTIDGLVPVALRLKLWPQTLQLLALPLLYGLAVLIAALGVGAFAWHFGALLRTPPLFFSLPVYLIPLLAGLALIAVLLRPLLPLRERADVAAAIDPAAEPQLTALLDQLCRRLGAPQPDTVYVQLDGDVQLALHAGRDGWQHGRYDLRIALPLLQNAPLPTLAGALAAELVSTRDPALLRLREIVRRTRQWLFHGMQSEPDRLSRYLAALPARRHIDWLRSADRSTRRQLACLFAIMTQHSSRQAERTLLQIGDRASVAIAGTDVIAQRLQFGYQLDRATVRALQKNGERRIDSRRVDDLAPLIGFFFEHPEADHAKKIAAATESGDAARAARYSDRERLADAERIRADFAAAAPEGRLVLQRGDTLGRRCTEALYAAQNIATDERLSSERLIDDALLDLEQLDAGTVYFNGWLIPARGWRLPDAALLRELSHADAREQLNVCVNEVRRLTPDRARLLNEFSRLQNQLSELLLGQLVLAANHGFQFRYLKYDGSSLTPLIEQRQRDIAKIIEQLGTQESIMGGRIALGLKLFGQDSAESEALHRTLHFLGEQEKALYRLEQDTALLEQLLQRQREHKERGHTDAIARLTEKVRDATLRQLHKLKDAPNPPDRRYSPLRDFFVDRDGTDHRDKAAHAAGRARSVLDGFYTLNEKLSLLAAEQASSVEEAYKIERIRLVGENV